MSVTCTITDLSTGIPADGAPSVASPQPAHAIAIPDGMLRDDDLGEAPITQKIPIRDMSSAKLATMLRTKFGAGTFELYCMHDRYCISAPGKLYPVGQRAKPHRARREKLLTSRVRAKSSGAEGTSESPATPRRGAAWPSTQYDLFLLCCLCSSMESGARSIGKFDLDT